jgi:hypothetical protein
MLFMIVALVDMLVLWCGCSCSKRKDNSVYLEENGIQAGYALKDFLAYKNMILYKPIYINPRS